MGAAQATKRLAGCRVACCALLLGVLGASPLLAAELPESTRAFMKKLQLSAELLSGLDEELKLPQKVVDAARKEAVVRILGTWDPKQFGLMNAPFRERFPEIKVEYNRASMVARSQRVLFAYKEGRYLTDVLTGFSSFDEHWQGSDALENMRDLPGFKNPLPNTSGADGTWVGTRIRYWCLTYNTDLVKKEDLPKTWDDLLTNKAWHNGNIGLGDRPQLWMLMLWGEKGKDWAVDYIDKFFKVVKPQLRKEGANALLGLTIAGEFHAALPAAAYRTKQYMDRGAPISWHCPEPVPLAVSQMGILKGSPHVNAARVWVNWFLSKEGQIAQYAADQAPPVHKDLQIEAFLQFIDQIKDRKIAYRAPDQQGASDELNQVWSKYWLAGGGQRSDSPEE